MPRVGGRRKKRRTEKEVEVSEREKQQTPRCFVLKRGAVGDRVRDLVKDVRQVMMPNSAHRLRESKMNRLEDFIAVAGTFHVSHMIIFSTTKVATWMKLVKLPQGPTLTFKVESFSLRRDVRASQKRPRGGPRDYTVAPLQVLNGFGGQAQAPMQQLTAEMLRGLFPAVDVPSFNQAECRRAALFHHDPETETVHFRHFFVGRRPAGVQRGVSKLMRASRLPKLGRCEDIADFILSGGAGASESEMEDAEEVPTSGSNRIAVKLLETGPRLALLLVKAEEGMCGGGVMYHRYRTRPPTERELQEAKARERRKLKERNARLEAQAGQQKASQRERKKRKKEAAPDRGDGSDTEKLPASGAGAGAAGARRQRFHPFAWGAKRARRAQQAGLGADANQGAGGLAAGEPEGRGRQGQRRILDRFHASAKR